MSYPTYYRMMPQMDWLGSKSLRAAATYLMETIASEGRKAQLEAELGFIQRATDLVMLQSVHALPQTIIELAEEVGDMFGDTPYDGSDPCPMRTWAGEALETAGVGSANDRAHFDAEDAAVMVFVPQETFDTVTHEVEAAMRALLRRSKEVERDEMLAAA